MNVKKIGGKVYGASFTAAERKALDIEIMKQLAEYTRKHALELDAVFLLWLHEELGFGTKRLKKAFMSLARPVEAMCDKYEMHNESDALWLCTQRLKEIGIDLEQWDKERGD